MPTLVELLDAGVHFGHKKERSHPRAKEFIFTLREGVYVIDLEKTQEALKNALEYMKRELSSGKTILFVGTKCQAKDLVKNTAVTLNMPYVTHRWLGGTLTNFDTIRKSLLELEKLENQTKSPEFDILTKKEKKLITDKMERLEITFSGIKEMKTLPDAIFVVDANKEAGAIAEANIKEIPVVALCDTDANPDKISYPIPANDDAPKSLEMLMAVIESELKVDVKKEPQMPKGDSARGGEKLVKKIAKKTVKKEKK